MKKILLLLLALVANHVNSQISPTTAKADPAAVAQIKKQLKDIEAEQEKLVLSIKGAPKVIQRAKDLQQKWQSVKTPELIKQEQELRELQIKACVAKKTNPEITKITARLGELHKITRDDMAKLHFLVDDWENLALSEDKSLWSDEQKKASANLQDQIEQLKKQIAEKTSNPKSEINRLHAQIIKLLDVNKITALKTKIDQASKIPSNELEKFAVLQEEFDQLTKESKLLEKNLKLNKKYIELLYKLPVEDRCAFILEQKKAAIYGGLTYLWELLIYIDKRED